MEVNLAWAQLEAFHSLSETQRIRATEDLISKTVKESKRAAAAASDSDDDVPMTPAASGKQQPQPQQAQQQQQPAAGDDDKDTDDGLAKATPLKRRKRAQTQGTPSTMQQQQQIAEMTPLNKRGGDRACWNCGQPGHLARNCPAPRSGFMGPPQAPSAVAAAAAAPAAAGSAGGADAVAEFAPGGAEGGAGAGAGAGTGAGSGRKRKRSSGSAAAPSRDGGRSKSTPFRARESTLAIAARMVSGGTSFAGASGAGSGAGAGSSAGDDGSSGSSEKGVVVASLLPAAAADLPVAASLLGSYWQAKQTSSQRHLAAGLGPKELAGRLSGFVYDW